MPRLPGRLGTLTARDVMTERLVVLSEGDPLPHAAQVLREIHITGAPVVDGAGKVVGLLALTDLIGHEPWGPDAQSPSVATVADRMTRNVATVWERTPITDVSRILCNGHWHRIPVINDAGKLTGIVSAMDILAALVQASDELGAS